MRRTKWIFFFLSLAFLSSSWACTIFCGIDAHNEVWAANNEDNPFNFYNYLNVFPKTEDTRFGYYTLSYDSTRNGENDNVQGGMNEAGLFFDFNTIPSVLIKDIEKKKPFPQGTDQILSHILAQMETVEEVVAFFDEYWFDRGFNSAQMHVADKSGTFAIIGPSGSRVLKKERYQISTNFDICGNGDRSNSWRFPIAEEALEREPIGLKTFTDICQRTAQKGADGISTIYSNIQNLNTGEVWFYFLSDYENPYRTSLPELLQKGRKSYLIRDLFKSHPITVLHDDFEKNGGHSAFEKFKSLTISEARKKEIVAIFVSHFLGNNYRMDALPFLEEYLKEDPIGYWMRAARAIAYFQNGDRKKAISIIKEYKKDIPETRMDVNRILDLFDGHFPEDTNTTLTLHGHQDAKHVFVKGGPFNFENFNFLIKKDDKWVGKFKLAPGVYHYTFVVDGVAVFDTKTPIKIKTDRDQWYKTHQICIGFTPESYPTTIRVKVPNADDVVYIAGNQAGLTHWNSVFRLKRVSDFEREIALDLHYPAQFKFTRGNWETEAIMENGKKDANGYWLPLEIDLDSTAIPFVISHWKDDVRP